MILRFAVFASEPMRDSSNAVGDTDLRRIGSRLNVAEKRRRVLPHRRQLAATVAADPQTEVSRRRSCAALSPTADSWVPLLPSRRLGLNLIRLREGRQQFLRVGDLGHLRRR
jgi:hypothetical protein